MNFLTWILALHVTVSSVHSKNKRIGHSGVVVVVVVVGGGGRGLSCIHSCMFLVTGPMTKEMSHMLSSLQVSYCTETKMSVVSIQVVSLRTQAVKLHKNFDHFRYSLRVNKKKTFGVYILPSLSQVLETINLHLC